MEELKHYLESFLIQSGIFKFAIPYVTLIIFLIVTLGIALLAAILTRVVLKVTVGRVMKRSYSKWNERLIKHNLLKIISLFAIIIIFKIAVPILFEDFPKLSSLLKKFIEIYFVFIIFKIIIVILKSSEDTLIDSKLYINKPISSYFQMARIVLMIIAFILALSIILNKSPVYFLSIFGALSAILLLVFKDTILGLVASVQISTNDMIRIGDWIEMTKFNADGNVQAINLNTVKVQNFDNTITTVPTYYFVTESFKNWRGMQESGGRRILRTLRISLNSIKFVDEAMRDQFMEYELIHDYIAEREAEIKKFNVHHDVNTDILINGRRLTNIGVFRIYIQNYLKNHVGIHKNMTLTVRQLISDESGVPLQVYCFANSVGMVDYEATQSDIFDHLFAAAPFFGLEIFQKPTGKDFQELNAT